MAEPKKYYWLKLKKDFFKRHDIRIIEVMPNGKDYILFYLKLLLESVDHEGALRFSDAIPYNEEMLATITNTNVDIVRSAMKIFTELKMIDVLEDSTIFMAEVEKMLGGETYWAEQKRKKRKPIGQCPDNVLLISNLSNQEIEIEKEIDKEKDKKNMPNGFDAFWNSYPKKISKGAAEKAWLKLKPNKQLQEVIITAINSQKKTKDWLKDNGQFIPYPSTWLNQKRWEDEIVGSNGTDTPSDEGGADERKLGTWY